jgi:hypothetical protein
MQDVNIPPLPKKKAVRCGSDVDRNNIIACTMEKEAGKAKSSAGRIQRCAYWAAAGASSSSLTRIISQLVLLENSDAFCAVAGVKLTNSFFFAGPCSNCDLRIQCPTTCAKLGKTSTPYRLRGRNEYALRADGQQLLCASKNSLGLSTNTC